MFDVSHVAGLVMKVESKKLPTSMAQCPAFFRSCPKHPENSKLAKDEEKRRRVEQSQVRTGVSFAKATESSSSGGDLESRIEAV